MKYDEIFARSFSRHDQKRFGYGALVGCIVVTWCLCTVFKPYLLPLPILESSIKKHYMCASSVNLGKSQFIPKENVMHHAAGLEHYASRGEDRVSRSRMMKSIRVDMRMTMTDGLKLVMVNHKRNQPQRPYVEIKETKPICDTLQQRSDICEMKGDVRIQGNSSMIFVFSSHHENSSWTIKPYARKGDESAMKSVTKFSIKSVQEQDETMPECTKTHNVPAILFSIGGYAGNNFHAFTDVIIPLYATSREFDREVKFLVANKRSRWTSKFQEVLDKLSTHEIIDIDRENEVHCFPSMIVGLKKENPKELHMDSTKDFTKFLRSTYSLERSTAINLTNTPTKNPRLLIVSRQKTRAFTNLEDVVRAAQDLGFEVIVSEMNVNLTRVSRLVNSCDVMMGVHGAGLTNMAFLPENGVLIQVVPWGKMDWLANTYFGYPSKEMGLKYLEYKIAEWESSLIEQYPVNHSVFMDPFSIQRKGWGHFRSIYMDKQNVKLDVVRFKERLSKALEFLH